ncbi:hypothetical protein GEMRC1_005318 [Eukaryota sp. GEM-RC1]
MEVRYALISLLHLPLPLLLWMLTLFSHKLIVTRIFDWKRDSIDLDDFSELVLGNVTSPMAIESLENIKFLLNSCSNPSSDNLSPSMRAMLTTSTISSTTSK